MGVVYKLKPELKDAIIDEKRNNPQLSCRKLIKLIEEKYQVRVSKSSVNYLIKGAGLSLPLGRKSRQEEAILIELPMVEVPAASISVEPVSLPAAEILPEPIAVETIVAKEPGNVIGMGALFLKAADSLLGGSSLLTESISKRLNRVDDKILFKTEMLIYKSLPSNSRQEIISKQSIPESEIM